MKTQFVSVPNGPDDPPLILTHNPVLLQTLPLHVMYGYHNSLYLVIRLGMVSIIKTVTLFSRPTRIQRKWLPSLVRSDGSILSYRNLCIFSSSLTEAAKSPVTRYTCSTNAATRVLITLADLRFHSFPLGHTMYIIVLSILYPLFYVYFTT